MNCSILLNIADNLKILAPANDPLPWDILSMTKWKATLWELIMEMKFVQEYFDSDFLIHNTSVYVVTSSPYDIFLRALVAEILDSAERRN